MKKLLLTFLFLTALTAVCTLNAQVAPSIEWEKSLGGNDWEQCYSIQQIFDGGFIVAGSSSSNDGDVSGNNGLDDCWVVRLDTIGNIVWQKCLGGSSSDGAYSVQQTIDSGFIVAGTTASNDSDVSGNHGSGDYWIVKLNPEGNIVWQKCLGGTGSDGAYSVRQTTDGGFIVAGSSGSSDGDVSINQGLSDYWIVKLDEAGNLIWQKSFGGSYTDKAYSIQQMSDGGFIVAGYSGSNNGDVSGHHDSYFGNTVDYWIVKLDTVGNLVWQKSLGGTGDEYATSIQQTMDGGFIVAGNSNGSDGDVSGNHGGWDYWIVRLDSVGNILWQKSLGGSGGDYANSVQQTTDGGFIVAGWTNSNDSEVEGNYGLEDYWIVKLDMVGNLKWQKTMGGSEAERAVAIQQTKDSGYIVAGQSFSNDGNVSGNHGGSYDYWIVKLSRDKLTGIVGSPNNFFSIYPNPVQSQLIIDLDAFANPTFEMTTRVYDLQGKIVALPTSFTNTQARLNTTGLADGFYTVQITNNKTGDREVGMFVKAK